MTTATTTTKKILMKAIVQNGFGAPEKVLSISNDIVKPTVSNHPDHVVIKVHASSVNTPDWAAALGIPYIFRLVVGGGIFSLIFKDGSGYGPKNRLVGTDVAGVIEQVGSNVRHVKVGDEVFGSTGDDLRGAFAEYALAPATSIIKKPKDVSFEEAAGSVMSGLTALSAIRDAAKIGDDSSTTTSTSYGKNVLINGASGGVGTFCIQMAKRFGARKVTAVCSSRNFDLVRQLGADDAIDYTVEDFTKKFDNTENENEKYDVIIDNVLNHSFKDSSKALKKDSGIIVPNSLGTGRSKWFGAIPMFITKPSNFPTADCVTNHDTLQVLADMMTTTDHGKNDTNENQSGTPVKVVIDKVFDFDECAKAVQYMASNRARGQVIIRMVK